MANQFANIPAPAGNGSGAAVDVSSFGESKSIVVSGSWPKSLWPSINIEINNAAVASDGSWAPVATFQGSGTVVVDVAARWMRATVANFRGGSAPDINIGGTDDGATLVNLPVTAGDGAGAAIDVSALGLFKTVQIGSQFRGALLLEVSTDGGVTWAQELAFNNPGQRSIVIAADFMRMKRSGVPQVNPGLPVVNIAASDLSGGGGVVGPGTINTVAKFVGASAVGDSGITDDGSIVNITARMINAVQTMGTIQQTILQCIGQGVDHDQEAVAIVGYIVNMTMDTTISGRNAIGGQFRATATNNGGPNTVTNIAVQGEATGGDYNYSWFSGNGVMYNAGEVTLATAAGMSATLGNGAVAAPGTGALQINLNTTFEYSKTVTLGQNVQPFFMPGTALINPKIQIGYVTASSPYQLTTQNTMTAGATGGINVRLDTTVNASARGGLVIDRGPGGAAVGGNNAGVVVSSATAFPFTTSAANDISLYNELGGGVVLGADNVGYTAAMRIAAGPANAITMYGSLQVNGNIGFYGTAPIAKQVGVAVGAPAIHAALVALGLIGV